MRFQLPDSLLASLRKRRDEQRGNEKAPSRFASVRRLFRKPPSTFFDTVTGLFAAFRPNVDRAALRYVDGMSEIQREVEDDNDAFLLDPGMGPMLFITADGRVLVDGRNWDGEALREATDDEAAIALVVGAKKTDIRALLELFPSISEDGLTCPMCDGRRWAKLVASMTGEVVCPLCSGWGWVTVPTLDAAKEKGLWPPSHP